MRGPAAGMGTNLAQMKHVEHSVCSMRAMCTGACDYAESASVGDVVVQETESSLPPRFHQRSIRRSTYRRVWDTL